MNASRQLLFIRKEFWTAMRISGKDEVVFRNFDVLKEAFEEMAKALPGNKSILELVMSLYFSGRPPGKIFKTYLRSRDDLIDLLGKDSWDTRDSIEAIKKGVKLCATKYYIDFL